MGIIRASAALTLGLILWPATAPGQALANRVRDIDFSPRCVWLACGNGATTAGQTMDGAARRLDKWSGTWTTFTVTDIFGSAIEGEIGAVCAVSDTEIWAGFDPRIDAPASAGVAVSHNSGTTWTVFTPSDGLGEGDVADIVWDSVNGDLWVAHATYDTGNIGLSRTPDGGTTWFTHGVNDNVTGLSTVGGQLWAAAPRINSETGPPLMRTDNRGGAFTEYTSAQLGGLARMTDDVFATSGGRILAAADGFFYDYFPSEGNGGIALSTDGGATWTFRTVTGANNSTVESACIASNGDLWVSTRFESPNSVHRSVNDGVSWTRHGTADGLPSSSCFTVRVDETNPGRRIIWAGLWDDRAFANFTRGYAWSDDDGATWHDDGAPTNIPPLAVGDFSLYR